MKKLLLGLSCFLLIISLFACTDSVPKNSDENYAPNTTNDKLFESTSTPFSEVACETIAKPVTIDFSQDVDLVFEYGDFEISVYDGYAVISKYSGNDVVLDIPTEINGYQVIAIGSAAFYYCDTLENITLHIGVTSINNAAFWNCSSLKSISIPDGVSFIGDSAFEGCASLTSVTIPGSVTSIGKAAFYKCTSLESIIIHNGITTIGNSAFMTCPSLTYVEIPNSVTTIETWAFAGCESLKDIEIPNSVVSIAKSAFDYCPSIKVKCLSGSYAEQYAKENNILCITY